MLVAMCIITMILGNFVAIFQTNIKRLLAYSSIAQAGYALIGLVTLTQDGSGATLFYLLMYVFTNIAAFGVIILVSNVTGSDDLKDLSGLNRRSPFLALVMLFAVLSLGGIPPTAGFFGKFFLFKAAVDAGLWWLAAIGILMAFVGLYYYLSIIKYMYLYRSEEDDVAIPVSRAAQIGLVVSVLFILYLGVFAGPAFEWTRQAAAAFFIG
jgi:NADH-quinone oxidoreductase subunit N